MAHFYMMAGIDSYVLSYSLNAHVLQLFIEALLYFHSVCM